MPNSRERAEAMAQRMKERHDAAEAHIESLSKSEGGSSRSARAMRAEITRNPHMKVPTVHESLTSAAAFAVREIVAPINDATDEEKRATLEMLRNEVDTLIESLLRP